MVNLPEEVLIEILLRLPVKSLVRFRCVGKSWLALFKSPHFVDLHLKLSLARNDENVLIKRLVEVGPRSDYQSLISVHSDDRSLSEFIPNFEEKIEGLYPPDLHFVGSCNGLVCGIHSLHDDDVILFNPTLRELRTLPPSPQPCPEFSYWQTKAIGFGFDPASNDYKVIRVLWTQSNRSPNDPSFKSRGRVEIYSLSNDTWRELEVDPPPIVSSFTKFSLFCNERIHWYACDGDYDDDYSYLVNGGWIVSWNFSTEVFGKLKLPVNDEDEEEERGFQSLLVIQDCLALIFVTSENSHPQSITIWIMEEYGVAESWSRKYYITVPVSLWLYQPVITVWRNERLLIEGIREGTGCHLLMCDINSEQWENFGIFGVPETFIVIFYKESLVSVARI